MAVVDRRGVNVSTVDLPIVGDPNPGLAIKAPAVVATTGSNIVLSGVQTIDGVTVGNNAERVLVKDQTDPTTNGLYNASSGIWTRTIDANSNDQFTQGLWVSIAQGTTNGQKQFQLASANRVLLGTSAITWAVIAYPDVAIEWTVNGGGAAIPPGYQDDFEVPFACTIKSVRLVAGAAGTMQIDIWRAPYASFPPVVGNSICGGDLPALVNAQTMQDTLLTGWTTLLNAGDWLRFNLNTNATVARFTLSLRVTRN